MLILYKADFNSIISLKIKLFSSWYFASWKTAELALSNTHLLTQIILMSL